VVMTYDGTTIRMYLNGAASGTAALAGPKTISKPIAIAGKSGGSANFLQGFVAECAIFPTALSAARVLAHYNAADTLTAAPVWSASGGLLNAGAGSNDYSGILQKILNAVTHTFQNTT